jgi:hypothetical protein
MWPPFALSANREKGQISPNVVIRNYAVTLVIPVKKWFWNLPSRVHSRKVLPFSTKSACVWQNNKILHQNQYLFN